MATGDPIPFEFEFFISSVIHGNGRSTSDRQFYYINSRPCEPAKITKLVNEIYRQFNGGQYPFVYLNILTETSQVDVNVTPDKRQIFLEKEKLLLATIKATLLSAFKQFPSTYKIQNANVTRVSETLKQILLIFYLNSYINFSNSTYIKRKHHREGRSEILVRIQTTK